MKTYEYIFAAIIMVAILLAAVFLTGISPPLYRSTSEMEQLKMAAQKIMAQILLSPGEPDDWGENITIKGSDLSSFGLAVSTVFTREAFVLDPDKVQRLSQSLPGNIPIQPNTVRSLLNLGFDYNIKMEFIPTLKIEIRQTGLNNIEVNVVSEQGMPAVNAKVTVGAVFLSGGVFLERDYGFTDENGCCSLTLNFFSPALLIAAVDHYGVQGVAVETVGAITHAYFIGNFFLSPYSISGNEVYQIFLTKLPNGSINMMSVQYSASFAGNIGSYYVHEMDGIEPYTVAVVAAAGSNLMAAWKIIPESFGSLAEEMPLAYMLERSVKIGFSSYTVRLWVWRMSW